MRWILKNMAFCFLLMFVMSCKKDKPSSVKKEPTPNITVEQDTLTDEDVKRIHLELKKEKALPKEVITIIKSKDDDELATDFLQKKTFFKETNDYKIDFTYPYLNEKFDPKFEVFNSYINDEVANYKSIIKEIEQEHRVLCDSLVNPDLKELRKVEYKVYLQDQWHLSILFYKLNYYKGAIKPTTHFSTLNFDKIHGKILTYDDYFSKGSEEDLLSIINEKITSNIELGKMSNNCFAIEVEDFMRNKNNFVVNDDSVFYYFNDCVMCDASSNTYSIEIPLEKLLPVFKQSNIDRFELKE